MWHAKALERKLRPRRVAARPSREVSARNAVKRTIPIAADQGRIAAQHVLGRGEGFMFAKGRSNDRS